MREIFKSKKIIVITALIFILILALGYQVRIMHINKVNEEKIKIYNEKMFVELSDIINALDYIKFKEKYAETTDRFKTEYDYKLAELCVSVLKEIDYYNINVAIKEVSVIKSIGNLILDGNNYDNNLEDFYKKVGKINNYKYRNHKEYYDLGEDVSDCILDAGEYIVYGMISSYSRGDYFQKAYDKAIEAVKMINDTSNDWLTQSEKEKYYKELYDYSEKLRNYINNPYNNSLKNDYMQGTEEIIEITTGMMKISIDANKKIEDIIKSSETLYIHE